MMTIRRKLLIPLLFFSAISCLFLSCASDGEASESTPATVREVAPVIEQPTPTPTPVPEPAPARQEPEPVTAPEPTPAPAPAPKPVVEPASVVLPTVRQKTSYFENINADILNNAMKGSPASLRAAAALQKADESSYTEEEKVLLFVMSAIMKYAWQSETVTWTVPSGLPDNDYTAAVDSVKMGVYDTSAGNADFFTLVIPSLLLCTQKVLTICDMPKI